MVVFLAGTMVLISQESNRLEKELLYRGRQHSIVGAKMIGTIMEQAIDNARLSLENIFDTQYEPSGNSFPPKYHTRYDRYFDQAVLGVQDEFLKDSGVVYAVASDRNGYIPTHNSRYQLPMTGDPEKDKTINRTKRIFDDPIGIKAARNTEPAFLQIYHRDTGEVLWDISTPIIVKGKHWGAFRVGMSHKVIAEAKKRLSVTLFGIMFMVLLISVLLASLSLNHYLKPIKAIASTANDLAKGEHLEKEIAITSQDELGELQQVLDRLRLSILIAMQRGKK
jgi:methyl-accepting chemotaxis protein